MEPTNQPKKKQLRKLRPRKQQAEKPLETGTEEAIKVDEVVDPVLQTLTALHATLQSGRQILDHADAILVYYVAIVNREGVISSVKGTNHMSGLLKESRRSDAAMTVDTLLTVAVTQPMVGKIQEHMEETAEELKMEASYATEKDLKQALLGGLGNADRLLQGADPRDAEMVVNGDAEISEQQDGQQ